MQDCVFVPAGDGQITCGRCGRPRKWDASRGAPPARNCLLPGEAVAAPRRQATAAELACSHRGQVTRTVACASCNKSTVELPVYACALHGECRLSNAAELTGVRPCDGCTDREQGTGNRAQGTGPEMPGFGRRAKNYAGAVLRDLAAGQPRRSPELVARIYDQHCALCPRNVPDEGSPPRERGTCAHPSCGCPISRGPIEGRRNKLEWGAEKCPEGRWPIQKTNLIFYILPLKHPAQVWQWHVSQLRKYQSLFSGRRIVTIATAGPGERLDLDSADVVKRAFGADAERFEFRLAPNDPQYWETPHFRAMLEMVQSNDANEATFYGHAKGVRRASQAAVRPWCEAMYRHNLERQDEVLEILSVYPCCGIAKIPQNPTSLAEGGNWHFAGTFFWFIHGALFGNERWRSIANHSHAVEGYLSTQFDAADAYCLAYEGGGNVYSPVLWTDTEAEAHTTMIDSAQLPTVSIVIAGRDYGHWLGECLDSCFAQTHPPLEVIYVDDASSDGSLDVARARGARVIELTEHVGAEQARNIGAGEANGRALLFVDADNVLPPDYLRKMVSRLNNDCPFVYPGELRLFGDETGTRSFPDWGAQNLRDQNHCESCSLIWREAFDQAGGWWPGFGHMPDWHLFLRLSCLGTPVRAPVALGYRVHGDSWSERLKRERPNWEEELLREILQSVDEWAAARRRPQLAWPDDVDLPAEPPTDFSAAERQVYHFMKEFVELGGEPRQNLFEFARLIAFLRPLPPAARAIEIGTYRFGSGRLLLDLLQLGRLVTIDNEQRLTTAEYLSADGRYGDRLWLLRGDSLRLSIRDSAAAGLLGAADLLVIDGGHGYRWVAQDFALYRKLVRPGGLIAIHDIAGEPEVDLFWRHLKRDEPERCTEIIGPAGPWGAMGWGVYRVAGGV